MRNSVYFNTKGTSLAASCFIALALTACGSDNGNNNVASPAPEGYSQGATPDTARSTSLGNVLTAQNDLTLYTFENDTPGKSNCNGFAEGECADIWPPLYADANAVPTGDFSVIQRDDGSDQWAFKEYPLYFYKFDSQAGDVNGEDVNNVWFVARPDPFSTTTTGLGTVLTVAGSIPNGDGNPENRKNLDGFSLYTFTVDQPGKSNCNGFEANQCAEVWPPLYADKAARASGDFSIITRDEQTQQWAYKDYPLYFYKRDNEAGDTNGEDVNNIWFVARPTPITMSDTALGKVFAGSGTISQGDGDPANRRDFDGFTLYTFANDMPGVSNCNGLEEDQCAEIWPPLYADKEARETGDFSIITRDDGSRQWALNEYPLYFFKDDTQPGDVNGHEVNNVWFVASPAQ